MEYKLTKITNTLSKIQLQFPVAVFNAELSKIKPSALKDGDNKPILNPSANHTVSIPHGSKGTRTAAVGVASIISTSNPATALQQHGCDRLTVGCRVLKDKLTGIKPKAPEEAMSTVLPYIGFNISERNRASMYPLSICMEPEVSIHPTGTTVLATILDGSRVPKGGSSSRDSTGSTTPFIRYESMLSPYVQAPCTVLYNAGLANNYVNNYRVNGKGGANFMSTLLSSGELDAAVQTQGNIFYTAKGVEAALETAAAMDDSIAASPWGALHAIMASMATGKTDIRSYYRNRNRAVFGAYTEAILKAGDLSKSYTRLSSVPVTGLCGGLVMFISIVGNGNKFMPLPDSFDMTTIITNDELGGAYIDMVHAIGEDDIKLAFKAFESVPVLDLKPSALLPDGYKGDIVEFLASPVVMSMVKSVHRGWCYSNPATADKEYETNPPLQYRGVDMKKQQATLTAIRDYMRFKGMLATATADIK